LRKILKEGGIGEIYVDKFLIDFATRKIVTIKRNIMFPRKDIYKYTWVSLDQWWSHDLVIGGEMRLIF